MSDLKERQRERERKQERIKMHKIDFKCFKLEFQTQKGTNHLGRHHRGRFLNQKATDTADVTQ